MYERYQYYLEKKPKYKSKNKLKWYKEVTDPKDLIISMADELKDLIIKAQQGDPESICKNIFTFLGKYKEYIHEKEIANLFQMYCAYALLTCTYSFIPSMYEKPYYYYYQATVCNNIEGYIRDPQPSRVVNQNSVIMDDLIKMFRKSNKCLSKYPFRDRESISKMYCQSLTVIINSSKSGEYFTKLTELDPKHKKSLYEETKLNEIFYNRTFYSHELKYLYNYQGRIAQLENKCGFENAIGTDKLKFYYFGSREKMPELLLYESLPNASFKKFLKYRNEVETLWPNIEFDIKLIFDNRNQSEISDILTMQNIIKTINGANSIFEKLYEHYFIEEPYIDSILEEINELSQFYMQQEESLQNQPIRSLQNFNIDYQEINESDSEDEEETVKIKRHVEDPIDKVEFIEENAKIDEEAEAQDKFFSIRNKAELKDEDKDGW